MSTTTKLFLPFLFAFLLRVANFQTLTECSSPFAWDKGVTGSGPSGSSYITDGVTHVTQIVLFYATPSGGLTHFYGLKVSSGPPNTALTKIPTTSASCYTGLTETMTLSATQRVNKVIAHKVVGSSSGRFYLFGLDITLNDGTILSKAVDPTYSGKEFVGFFLADETNNCEVTRLAAYYRPDCAISSCITLNLSNI